MAPCSSIAVLSSGAFRWPLSNEGTLPPIQGQLVHVRVRGLGLGLGLGLQRGLGLGLGLQRGLGLGLGLGLQRGLGLGLQRGPDPPSLLAMEQQHTDKYRLMVT